MADESQTVVLDGLPLAQLGALRNGLATKTMNSRAALCWK